MLRSLNLGGSTRRLLWIASCLVVVLIAKPWRGGDGAIAVWILLVLLSFPLGLFVPALYSYFDLSRLPLLGFEWTPLVLIVILGYVQWFVLLPRFMGPASNNRIERTREP